MGTENSEAKLIVLCGIPGSGKSTLTKNFSLDTVSTDELRKFLWGDESIVKHDRLVFDLSYRIIDYRLKKQMTTVFDATNLRYNRRKEVAAIAIRNGAIPELYVIDCPLKTALARNAARNRRVPEKVLLGLHRSFQWPTPEEGYQKIVVFDEWMRIKKINYSKNTFSRKKYYRKDELVSC